MKKILRFRQTKSDFSGKRLPYYFVFFGTLLVILVYGCFYISNAFAPTDIGPLGGKCVEVMSYVDNAKSAIDGEGVTYTADDVVQILYDSGTKLSRSYSAELVGSKKNAELVKKIGNDLLTIRVGVLDNSSDMFTEFLMFDLDYSIIKDTCVSKK